MTTPLECVYIPLYNQDNDIILGPDRISNKYIYIRVSMHCSLKEC